MGHTELVQKHSADGEVKKKGQFIRRPPDIPRQCRFPVHSASSSAVHSVRVLRKKRPVMEIKLSARLALRSDYGQRT